MLTRQHVATAYLLVPGREAVTVALNRTTPESVTVSDAWRKQPAMNKLAFSEMQLGTAGTKWCIPQILLNPTANGREIRNGDQIVDGDGQTWDVLTASLVSLQSRWECVCARTALG